MRWFIDGLDIDSNISMNDGEVDKAVMIYEEANVQYLTLISVVEAVEIEKWIYRWKLKNVKIEVTSNK